jgi:flagellar assembly protein FliH
VAEVEARWQSLAPVLQEAIESVRQLQTRWLRDWEDRAIELAVAIAARLVRRELAHDPRISQQWMREALQLATGCSTVTLRLHPDDYATLGNWQHQLTREFSGLSPARIVADPQIARGGCRVDTEFGFIDQQLETQLTRLQEELTG